MIEVNVNNFFKRELIVHKKRTRRFFFCFKEYGEGALLIKKVSYFQKFAETLHNSCQEYFFNV